MQFATYQAKGGKVTAVATMQRDPIVAKASELLRLDLMPSLDDIRNGKVSHALLPPPGPRSQRQKLTRQNILEIDLVKA